MKKLVSAAAALVILASTLSGCYFFPNEEELLEPPTLKVEDVTYSTYSARLKTITSTTIVTGYVTSALEKKCYFTGYTGQLKTIYVKAGDVVKQGDLVAELNMGTLDYDLEIQKLKVQLAQMDYSSSGSSADRLQLEIEQNTLDKLQSEFDGAKVYAPCDGQVSYVEKYNPGDEVNPYKVLVKIVDPDDLYIKAEVKSTNNYIVGDKVELTIGEKSYSGTVTRTPAEAKAEGDEDITSVSVAFDGENSGFATIGELATITKVNKVSENAVVIPKNLVQTLDDRTYVKVYKDGAKVEVDVTVGITNATEAEILTGLSEGDQVVVK